MDDACVTSEAETGAEVVGPITDVDDTVERGLVTLQEGV